MPREIPGIMPGMNTAQEQRLRRKGKRLGLRVEKSRAMISSDNYGGFRIVDPDRNAVLHGEKFDLTLDDVDKALAEIEAGLRVNP